MKDFMNMILIIKLMKLFWFDLVVDMLVSTRLLLYWSNFSDHCYSIMASTLQFFPCPTCGKLFQQKFNLNLHIRTVHDRSACKFICPVCEEKLPRRDYLQVTKFAESDLNVIFLFTASSDCQTWDSSLPSGPSGADR